ncbi:thiol-specific monooxygenase [Plectosphaerella cucumerina]|uniref:Thiol-specific monooxygenase n=1 Tax=Plectosphaerella cucumerina TaxID=40658 RepID=A0A8K0THF2_9PEZI|nr:thiol-specific monooxygenase [Plectosphaerella cucumerina]
MSPIHLNEDLDIDSVAVIGAGPCGLSAAKYLLAEKKFSRVQVFEQKATVGGVWVYSPWNSDSDTPIDEFASPVYDFLETNIPHTLMNYSDLKFPEDSSLFPRHQVVKKYLDGYAEPLKPLISLSTQVLSVKKIAVAGKRVWEIQTRNLETKETTVGHFDAVLVANGHYNDEFLPDIPGLDAFRAAHPGSILHSKLYRNPDQYRDKKVIVVGNSASGVDISAQISTCAQLPIIVSEKTTPDPSAGAQTSPWAKFLPEISEFIAEDQTVRFANGHIETNIDAVIFCTGYLYTFPFLKDLSPAVTGDGNCVLNLYQHLFYIDDRTLAFAGLPQRIVPFPFSEGQAAWAARVWSGRTTLPPAAEMNAWAEDLLARTGGGKSLHNLAFPQDLEYINMMHGVSLAAEKRQGLENEGVGKLPPFWDEDTRWVRQQMPLIKAASRQLGEKRHRVKTLGELGFDPRA